MKQIKIYSLLITLTAVLIFSCSEKNEELDSLLDAQTIEEVALESGVDPNTPKNTIPIFNQTTFFSRNGDGDENPDLINQTIIPNTEWYCTWSDEFDGSSLNTTKWKYSSVNDRPVGPGVQSNGIDRWNWDPSNVSLSNGNLNLKVTKKTGMEFINYNDESEGKKWVRRLIGGSVETRDKHEFKFGYFEVKVKIAEVNRGTHTAFWLQSSTTNGLDGTGADGSEIDVFESVYRDNNKDSTTDDKASVAIHYDGYLEDHKSYTIEYKTPGIHSGFHTFGMHWNPDKIEIYYDGLKVSSLNPNKPFPITLDANKKDIVSKVPEWLWLSTGAAFKPTDFNNKEFVGDLTSAKFDYARVFKLRPLEGEEFKIRNKKANSWIKTFGSADNSVIKQTNNSYGEWTNWKIQKVSDNKYFIINTGTNKRIRPQDTNNNSKVLLKPSSHSGTWLQWEFIDEDSDGYFLIKNVKTGKFLKAASNGNGASTVVAYKTGDLDSYKWKLIW